MSSQRLGPSPTIRSANPSSLTRGLGRYKGKPEDNKAIPTVSNTPGEPGASVRPAQQSRIMSRIPQSQLPSSSGRRPSNPSPQARPSLTHQGQSWSSSSSASVRSGSNLASSGSSSSGKESGLKTTPSLRRKAYPLTQTAEGPRNHARSDSARTGSTSSNTGKSDRSIGSYDRTLTESPTEIRVAHTVDIAKPATPTLTIYPELDRYRGFQQQYHPHPPTPEALGLGLPYKLTTHDLPPPTPGYMSGTGSQLSALSASPSTRFSGSPGPGAYSRDTTPTSMSSQSPGLVAPLRFIPPRAKHSSPAQTRPPVTRRRAGSLSNGSDAMGADPEGLAAVREYLTSSSSNSTVRGSDTRKKPTLQAPPSSPPPRKPVQSPERVTRRLSRRPSESATSPPPAMTTSTFSKHPQTLSPRGTPPVRPSRNGTPDMQSQLFEPIPVIQSNLSSASLAPERRGSEPHTRNSSLPRSTTPSSQPDRFQPGHRRRPSGQEVAPTSRSGSYSDTTKKPVTQPNRLVRTPSPNVSTFNSRFPFFGRKKSAPATEAAPPADKKDKGARKGPAAGTGHEGYGRLGAIRRRSSGVINPPRGAVPSQTSQESLSGAPQFTDPFLRDRMNPVIIAGGEIIENRNESSTDLSSRTESSTSFYGHSRQRSTDSKTSASSRETTGRNTLWPSAFPRSQQQPATARGRRPSESSDDEGLMMKRTLAFRRSVHKLRTSPEQEPMRLPKPINTGGIAPSPLTSIDTGIMSNDSTLDMAPIPQQQESSKAKKSSLQPPKKLTKPAKSPRKWNLFSRSQGTSQAGDSKGGRTEAVAVAATVKVIPTKQVAFYTMMDSSEEQEDAGDVDVMEVLRDAEVYEQVAGSPRLQAPSSRERRPSATSVQESAAARSVTSHDLLAQEPAAHEEAEIRIAIPLQAEEVKRPQQQAKPPRPVKQSRLPQVGRIPKVVSSRPEQVSPRSFSRPFNRMSVSMPASVPTPVPTVDSVPDKESAPMATPSAQVPMILTPELAQQGSTTTIASGSQDFTASPSHIIGGGAQEFLRFSPRKGSTTTTSSSSCCSAIYAIDSTAVVPSPTAPLAEDEIWDEYNDLLGDFSMKSLPLPLQKTLNLPLKTSLSRLLVSEAPESPTIVVKAPKVAVEEKGLSGRDVPSSVYSCDMTDYLRVSLPERSPTTPFSISQFVEGYGDRNQSTDVLANPVPAPTSSPTLLLTGPATAPPQEPLPQPQRNSGSSRKSGRSNKTNSCSSKASEDDTPLAQVNLRVGSMTVSKWLTFGHVLFSPVRDELVLKEGSRESHSILVIDGLGNDDWSFYAAETYPKATFFNLSPRAPLPEDRRNSTTFPLSPSNHYQIQYTSHLDRLPFGPETFTLVVFRFPAAAPETHYRNIIAEAYRVLKPGGYIELSILDVDLNNMGNRGRRAVRKLKERAHARDADVSLGSTADLVVRLLGRRHFTDIKSCRVGVPVASSIARTDAEKAAAKKDRAKTKKSGAEQRSLAEMMNDDSDVADESIAKMVSKVGRWWYSRCYESAATASEPGAGMKKSIWSDRALLAECEEWGTSLKLMVCHARVPEEGKRVVSV